MTKQELAQRLAERKNLSTASAADQLDRVVARILDDLRSGKSAKLPGLGKLTAEPHSGIRFELEKPHGGKARKK
jgi:nucleoid DNA-binding protein